MKYILTILVFSSFSCFSQGFGGYIKKNAIKIERVNKLNDAVYDSLVEFQLIMVGEFHGTQEPAQFVAALATLVSRKEGAVSVGLEIPENELLEFSKNPTKENLLSSKFFSKPNLDGRNGQAWFDLVMHCASDPNINLFFFDNIKPNSPNKRDSIMYIGLRNQKMLFPNRKIITLTGNVHNQRVPFRDMVTTGMYCLQDSINFSNSKICSINHAFSEGTMRNNTGNGLELKTVQFEESTYTQSVSFHNYLVLYNFGNKTKYNALLYTRKVNHSNILEDNSTKIK